MALRDFDIDDNGTLHDALAGMDRALAGLPKDRKMMFERIGLSVESPAKKDAPISPTKSEYLSTLKGGKTKRTDFAPGATTAAITSDGTKDRARIYIPSNSAAGQYANFTHNATYKLGVGSRNKKAGHPSVGNLYIERNINDDVIKKIINWMLQRVKKRMEGK